MDAVGALPHPTETPGAADEIDRYVRTHRDRVRPGVVCADDGEGARGERRGPRRDPSSSFVRISGVGPVAITWSRPATRAKSAGRRTIR